MKTVLVTGAGRGIGLAVAKKFSSMGWSVLSLDKEFKGSCVGESISFDLRSLDKIPELIDRVGPIDTLINNAAVLFCDPMDSIPQDHIQEILEVNLLAPARLIESVSLGMRSRGGGLLTLNDGDRSKLDALFGYPGVVTGVDDFGDVLVRFRRFLHDEFRRRDANGDTFRLELSQDVFVLQHVARFISTARASGSVTRGPERVTHTLLRAS